MTFHRAGGRTSTRRAPSKTLEVQPVTTLEEVRARFARDQGLPFADSLTEASILRRPRRARRQVPRPGVQPGHHHLGLPQPGPQRRPQLPRRRRRASSPTAPPPAWSLARPTPPATATPAPASPPASCAPWPGGPPSSCRTACPEAWKWNGRNVFIADGSHVSMPDTPENQAAYPQPVVQQPGIGFPLARVAVLLSLATGACHDLAIAPYAGKGTGETTLLRQMYDSLPARRRGPRRRPVRQLLPRLRAAPARHRAGRPRAGGARGEPDGGEQARRRRHRLAAAQQAARHDGGAIPHATPRPC